MVRASLYWWKIMTLAHAYFNRDLCDAGYEHQAEIGLNLDEKNSCPETCKGNWLCMSSVC